MNKKEFQTMENIFRADIRSDIYNSLLKAMDGEYMLKILKHEFSDGISLLDEIVNDVMECSAISDEGHYNMSDVRLAIGRVFAYRFGIEI